MPHKEILNFFKEGFYMTKILIEIVGYVAACLTTISYLPQALKIIKLKKADEISLTMYLLSVSGTFLWLVYGLFMGNLPLILANAISCSFGIIIIFYKIKFG